MKTVYVSSQVVIPSSTTNNTFGAWTSFLTLPYTFDSVDLIFCGTAGSSYNAALNLGIGSSPAINLFSFLYFNVNWTRCHMPVRIPAGSTLYAQCAGGNTSTISPTLQLIGYTGVNSRSGSFVGSAGFSLSNTYIVGPIPSSSTTQVTSSPIPYRIKRLYLNYGADSNFTISVGIGPSTTMTEVIAPSLFFPGRTSNECLLYAVDCDIPAGNNLFIDNTSSTECYGGINYLV